MYWTTVYSFCIPGTAAAFIVVVAGHIEYMDTSNVASHSRSLVRTCFPD